MLTLMGPCMVSMLFLHIYFLARDNLASFPAGAVTILNYGWFIKQLPETLIGTAIAIALLPTLRGIRPQQRRNFARPFTTRCRVLSPCPPGGCAFRGGDSAAGRSGLFGFQGADAVLLSWATRPSLLGLVGHAWLEVAVRSSSPSKTPAPFVWQARLGMLLLYLALLSPCPGCGPGNRRYAGVHRRGPAAAVAVPPAPTRRAERGETTAAYPGCGGRGGRVAG